MPVLPRVSVETFTEVMVTNALSPMRVIEALYDLMPATGTLGSIPLLIDSRVAPHHLGVCFSGS